LADAQPRLAPHAAGNPVARARAQQATNLDDAVGDVVLRPHLPAGLEVVAALDAHHRVGRPFALAAGTLADPFDGVAGRLGRGRDVHHGPARGAAHLPPGLLVVRLQALAARALDLDRHEPLLRGYRPWSTFRRRWYSRSISSLASRSSAPRSR